MKVLQNCSSLISMKMVLAIYPIGNYVFCVQDFRKDFGDCDDLNANINPDIEICDEVDNNCNAQTDEGVQDTFYEDADDDSFENVDVTN